MPKSGQYESEWSIEILNGRFGGGLRFSKVRFYVLLIEKKIKEILFPACQGHFLP